MRADLSSRMWEENPDAVLAVGPDGRVLYWNRAAEHIFGYSAADAVGQPLGSLIIPSDRLEEEQRILRDAVTQDLVVYESVRRRKDGSLVHVSVSTKPVHEPSGRLSFLLSTKKDVTHLKVLRDAKLLAVRFSDLLESTPDAIVSVNITGRIVLVNSLAEQLFDYARGTMIGLTIEELLPAVPDGAQRPLHRVLSSRARARWVRGWSCTAGGATARSSRSRSR